MDTIYATLFIGSPLLLLFLLHMPNVRWNPADAQTESDDDEEDEEEQSEGPGGEIALPKLVGIGDEAQVEERGPPILTPISLDVPVDGQTPWILRRFPQHGLALVSSQLWPGAHAVAWRG